MQGAATEPSAEPGPRESEEDSPAEARESRELSIRCKGLQKAYDEVNRGYVFQMYGTEKKGQTFHEEHIASGTHGNRGSTFGVKA